MNQIRIFAFRYLSSNDIIQRDDIGSSEIGREVFYIIHFGTHLPHLMQNIDIKTFFLLMG